MDWPFIAGSTFCWSPEFVVYIATGLPRVGPFDVTGLCGHSNLLKVCSKIIGIRPCNVIKLVDLKDIFL